jgi:hypothetical protein
VLDNRNILDAHISQLDAHGAVSTALAGRIVMRDSAGRAQVAAPAAAADIANKGTVDAAQAAAKSYTDTVAAGIVNNSYGDAYWYGKTQAGTALPTPTAAEIAAGVNLIDFSTQTGDIKAIPYTWNAGSGQWTPGAGIKPQHGELFRITGKFLDGATGALGINGRQGNARWNEKTGKWDYDPDLERDLNPAQFEQDAAGQYSLRDYAKIGTAVQTNQLGAASTATKQGVATLDKNGKLDPSQYPTTDITGFGEADFTGDGSNMAFLLPENRVLDTPVIVAINGLLQTPTAHYYVTNNIITFRQPPMAGANIQVYYTDIPPIAEVFKVVTTLPATGEGNKIYLVPDPQDTALFNMFVWKAGVWSQVGQTGVDLTEYYTKGQIDTSLAGKAPTNHASADKSYGAASDTLYGHTIASSTTPKMNGVAAVGSQTAAFARGDHVHPTDTSRAANSQIIDAPVADATQISAGTFMMTAVIKKIFGNIAALFAKTWPITNGGTGATTAAGARTALGLGTAAVKDTGEVAANNTGLVTGGQVAAAIGSAGGKVYRHNISITTLSGQIATSGFFHASIGNPIVDDWTNNPSFAMALRNINFSVISASNINISANYGTLDLLAAALAKIMHNGIAGEHINKFKILPVTAPIYMNEWHNLLGLGVNSGYFSIFYDVNGMYAYITSNPPIVTVVDDTVDTL